MAALLAFARPHTIIGTVLAVVGLWAMAGAWAAGAPAAAGVGALVLALVAALATNVYIVGINQLTDVDIDRINKPFLPLAAERISMRTGRVWVATAGVLAILAAATAGRYLLAAVAIGLLVGTAYSVRPFRLKRFHVAAAASITSVRALTVNLLVYAHFQHVIDGSAAVPRHVLALTGMVLGLTIAIAWFKDIPDAIGDARHGIATLVLRLGVRRVLAAGLVVLGACYVSLIVAGLVGLAGVNSTVLVVGHLGLLAGLVVITRRTDLTDTESLRSFYSNIWRLFFIEYLVFPLAAVAAVR
ncbi:MAG TPA: homogentisate phytyltransferase [Euzebya sp.]|nr:homogentisate phytyltransferase [Euzebya sp.]